MAELLQTSLKEPVELYLKKERIDWQNDFPPLSKNNWKN